MSKNRYFQGGSVLAVTLAMSFAAVPAFAQQTAPAGAAAAAAAAQAEIDQCYAEAGDDEAALAACDERANAVTAVVSTGSRIRGLPEDAALPVEVLGRDQLNERGAPNVADLLKQMTESSSMAGDGNLGATGYGDAQISLRGMGSGRTLALVNGRRLGDMVSESGFTQGNSQDISSVPMGALQQVEILKDGGTTAYGADAVAGVINFITRRDLNGMEVTATHRFIDNTAGADDFNVLWGRRNDSGNILLSFQYEHRSPLRGSERVNSLQEPFMGGRKVFISGGLTTPWQTHTSAGQFAMQLPGQATFGVIPPSAFPIVPGFGLNSTVTPNENGFGTINPLGIGLFQYVEPALPGSFFSGSTVVVPRPTDNQFQAMGAAAGSMGRMRDYGCDELGGKKGFDILSQPACFQNFAYTTDIINTLHHYNFFGDANLRVTDRVQYHTEFGFRLQRNDVRQGPAGVNNGYQGYANAGSNPACEPLPATAPSRSTDAEPAPGQSDARNCTRSRASNFGNANSPVSGVPLNLTGFNSGVNVWSTPGFNPAVGDYLGRLYSLDGSARGLTAAQYQALVGTSDPLPALGPESGLYALTNDATPIINEFGQFVLPGGSVGRIALFPGTNGGGGWAPFGLGGNPAFEDGIQHVQVDNYHFRTVQQLKVDLGQIFGVTMDVDISGTYQRDVTLYQSQGILADRLQRALNGFATNLDDPDGDTCTWNETRGPRTYSNVPDPDGTGPNTPLANGATVQGIGYTVGAGGGADSDAYTNLSGFIAPDDTGVDPDGSGPLTSGSQAYAGNGCYFFNPFSTATATNPYQDIQAPLAGPNTAGHMAGALAPGGSATVGDFQGYAPGFGLANAPGIAKWLYEDRSRRLQSDNIYFDIAFNGDFAGLSLPGGPLGWAAGSQWRYVRREVNFDRLSNDDVNPCSFRTGDADPVFQGSISGSAANDQLRREDSSTCTNAANGPWADGYGGSNDYRQTRTVSVFGEVALPLTDTVTAQVAYRWEQENRNSRSSEGVGILSGSAKWQITPNFALRASAGETFDPTDVPNAGFTRDEGGCIGGLTTGGLSPNPDTECYEVNNTAIGPETGFNYNAGMIWQTPDRRLFTSLDYFNISVEGTPANVSEQSIARALTGIFVGNIPINEVIDCNTPAAQALFGDFQEGLDVGTGARPVVAYRDSQGNISFGCEPGTTFQGAPPAGGGVGFGKALSLAIPDQINADELRTSGVDGRIQYNHPDEVLGGLVSVGVDVTYTINRFNEGGQLFGVQLSQPQQLLGTNTGGLVYAIWKGNLTLTYRRGNHTVSLFNNAAASIRNFVSPIFTNTVPYFNYNPEASVRGHCLAALPPVEGGINGAEAILGPSGVGEGNYDPNCNVPKIEGFRQKAVHISTLTYLYRMPEQRASIGVTVENLFDREPEYFGTGTGYDTSGIINPFGRNYKITLTKAF